MSCPRLKQRGKRTSGGFWRKVCDSSGLVTYTPHPSPSSNSPTPLFLVAPRAPRVTVTLLKSHTASRGCPAKQGLTHSSHSRRSGLSSEDARGPRAPRTRLAIGSWINRQGRSSEERALEGRESPRFAEGFPARMSTLSTPPSSTAAWKSPQAPFTTRDGGSTAVHRMVLIHRHLALGPLPPPPALQMGKGGACKAGGGALGRGRRLWRRNPELSGQLSQEELSQVRGG